jgi:hypothetical protein
LKLDESQLQLLIQMGVIQKAANGQVHDVVTTLSHEEYAEAEFRISLEKAFRENHPLPFLGHAKWTFTGTRLTFFLRTKPSLGPLPQSAGYPIC